MPRKKAEIIDTETTGELTNYKGTTRKCLPLEKDDLTAILDLAVVSMRKHGGHPSNYPNDRMGLDAFTERCSQYFEYVQKVNANEGLERKLIPDVENMAVFLGITRQTLNAYERRGGQWAECIGYYKNVIVALKKQLALNFKIPPVLAVFDLCNNHGYSNTSEFKVTAQNTIPIDEGVNSLERRIVDAGLVWDETAHEWKPKQEGGQTNVDR